MLLNHKNEKQVKTNLLFLFLCTLARTNPDIPMAKYINDLKSALETAVEENKIEIAKNLFVLGLDDISISQATELTIKQVEQLRNEIKKN